MEEAREEAHNTEETLEAQEIQEEALVTKRDGATSARKLRMERKSDGKKVTVPVHISDSFDNEGKINNRTIYWNKTLLN